VGQHYVPQRYLRNFACAAKPRVVWFHDKASGVIREVAIKQVAQSRDYYTREVETLLAQVVEAPTYPVIAKLTAKRPIDQHEQHQLALFVATMLMRVPAHRRSALDKYPAKLSDYVAGVRAQIESLAANRPDIDPRMIAERLAWLDAWAGRHAHEPPEEIVDQIHSPWPYDTMVCAIEGMTWRIVESIGPQYFIATDNPAFHFGAYGLGSKGSELTFPLSTTHALHGSWQEAGARIVHIIARQAFVREFNRRLASTADRAFYHAKAPWLLPLLQKETHYLSVIHWAQPPRWRRRPPLVASGERYSTMGG
jgi:hypothetical protein